MKLIKLDAIDSTNDFLKALAQNEDLENFTVVTAQTQTKGRGQMGTVWTTESGKNLIMSLFVKNFLTVPENIFDLNIIVTVSVIESLKTLNIPKLKIKWPNDIMSGNNKIGGVLIENSIKHTRIMNSIVGLGLNINQIEFQNLPKASSLAVICEKKFNIELVLEHILQNIQNTISNFHNNKDDLYKIYTNLLFKKDIIMAYKNLKTNHHFMGIIKGIATDAKLIILLEDDIIQHFEIKEIQMLY